MPSLRKPDTARERFEQVIRNYRSGPRARWGRAAWASHRYRTIIRLLAIEACCRDLDMGVLPGKVVEALEILADFKEAQSKRYYVGRSGVHSLRRDFDPNAPIPERVVPTDEAKFRRLMRAVDEFKAR